MLLYIATKNSYFQLRKILAAMKCYMILSVLKEMKIRVMEVKGVKVELKWNKAVI